jgi:hypothetical protein
MKSSLFILLLIPTITFSQAKAKDLRAKDFKKYAMKSGSIEYEISGDATGSETLVFDDFGWTSLKKQTMNFELYGISSTQSVHEVTDGDFSYRLQPEDSTMSKRVDLKWSSIASYKSPDQLSEAILFSLGGTYASDSTLNDKVCQVWTFENKAMQEMWIWNGLVMKRKTKLGDRIVITTASKMEINVEVDPSQFIIPNYFVEKK